MHVQVQERQACSSWNYFMECVVMHCYYKETSAKKRKHTRLRDVPDKAFARLPKQSYIKQVAT